MQHLQLPPVRNALRSLTPGQQTRVRFIQPQLGKELTALHAENTLESPASNILTFRHLAMKSEHATPVHVHFEKEKVYIVDKDLRKGAFFVFLFIRNEWQRFRLDTQGQTLVVPPGRPHCIFCISASAQTSLLVIGSNQNGSDIQWEEDAPKLILNETPTD